MIRVLKKETRKEEIVNGRRDIEKLVNEIKKRKGKDKVKREIVPLCLCYTLEYRVVCI
jgi:hypothetical protein